MTEEIKNRIESIRKGEIPKGYRYTKDIGIAPTDWKLGKMSDIIENISRPVPKPDKPYWRLGIKSWAKGTFHTFVDNPDTVDMDELYEVKENDLIVNITFAWEHAIAIAKKEDEGLLVSHRFPTYVFKDGQIPEYYQAVISQQYFKDMLDHISPGGAGRNRVLNRKDFLNLPCYIPSLVEQRKIAEVLSTCDRVIELKQQLLDEKHKQKQWLMQILLSSPTNIKEIKLSKLCSKIGDGDWIESKDQSESGIRLIQTGNIGVGRYLDKGERAKFISEDTFEKLHCTEVLEGDVLISRLPDPIGRACKIPTLQTKAITAVDCTILRFKDKQVAEFFLQYATSTSYFNHISVLSGGSTRTRVSRKEIENLLIPVPQDAEKMEQIVTGLSILDKDIDLLLEELETWKHKKKALMQLLLTGIIRIGGH